MLKRILVPTDFSPNAATALDCAVDLARSCDAELVLLFVRDEWPYTARDGSGHVPRELDAVQRPAAEEELRELAASLAQRHVRVRTLHVLGAPEVRIVEEAEREAVDLIVMGKTGRSRLGRLMMGNVSERVLRAAKVPTLIVPAAEHMAEQHGAL